MGCHLEQFIYRAGIILGLMLSHVITFILSTGPKCSKTSFCNPRVPAGSAHRPEARLNIAYLVPVIHQLFAAGIATSSSKVYASGQKQFLQFCEKTNLPSFPVSENTLLLFVAFLHSKTLAPGTIKSYLAAIHFHQISRGLPDPKISEMPQLEYVIKGIKRASPTSSRCRLPITPTILINLKQVLQRSKNQYNASLLWAATCLCFFGFLRSGEVVTPTETEFDQSYHLGVSDVKVDSHINPTHMEVRIEASKTDPFHQGFTVQLGATQRTLCLTETILGFWC